MRRARRVPLPRRAFARHPPRLGREISAACHGQSCMAHVHPTLVALLTFLLACATAGAAEPRGRAGAAGGTELPPVEVTTLRQPVEKSYRRIVNGMDLF